MLLLLDSTTATSTTPGEEAHAAWANLISSNWSLCTIEVLMDPNNNRMQMWMKTTRGTLTPRNEQCVSFKTHCANTGPKRADLPQATKNEFPGARLPCTLMSGAPRSSASQLPHPLTSSPHAMSKPRMHLTGFRAGGELIRKR